MARVRFGVYRPLEDEADRIIRESLRGVTAHNAKRDVLSAWKTRDRYSKEVYVPSGTPDPALRRGMYHRAANTTHTDLNSRDGVAAALRGSSLRSHVESHGEGGWTPWPT